MRHAALKPLSLRGIALLVFILNTFLVACASGTSQPPSGTSQPVAQPTVNPQFACQQKKPVANLSFSGLAYGPYHTGQDPNYGIFPSSQEIDTDIPTLACLTNSIRIYSSLGPAQRIVQDVRQARMSVNLGIWLGSDATAKGAAANAKEIAAGVQLAPDKAVNAVTVGNEVLLRGDLSVDALRAAIQQVRARLGSAVPITTADVDGSWLTHPELANAVDFITVHLYPFWQKVPIDSAIQALDASYKKMQRMFPHKKIVIGETGWPSDGPPQGAAVPSPANQSRYLREFMTWAKQEKVSYYYFDAIDEGWKTKESGVGTHWGLYQETGVVKPALSDLLPAAAPVTLKERSYRDVYIGGLEEGFGLGLDTSNKQRNWLTDEQGTLLLAYPANQLWGTVFITFGQPVPPGNRPSIDLSRYKSLLIDLRAKVDGQCVRLGIKDHSQPDDGSEITIKQCLTTQWSTIALPLDTFANVDLAHLYVVFEIVFLGTSSESVELGGVSYSLDPSPALPTPPPVTMPFNVYTEMGSPDNHYVPTGGEGDYKDVIITEGWTQNPHSGTTCIQVVYSGAASQGNGWAGFYWQDPVNNWGKTPGPTGYDLSNASHLSLWVRGKVGGEKVKFLVGGINGGNFGDSLQPAVTSDVITLTTSWQQVTLDLSGQDLRHIIGGFAWVVSKVDNPNGATFYLDDIVYTA